ncbi:MAG: pyridoxal 5'-phosphate synthase [Pseudomonadota bacterium]|nr:pyridoxal 5'-phosphate synthase [Pseudomonadota bacterium]
MADEVSSCEKAIVLLTSLIAEARARGDGEASTAALATASVDAQPSVRTVSVVSITSSGLILFAHTETGKGQQMQYNPRAALCFHWPKLHYQVIVEGEVALLSEEESDAQWSNLPRDYSLGRWASDQTTHADARPSALKDKARAYRQQFDWTLVPRAPFWRAFEIRPGRIDFWPSGGQRLRPRECYLKASDGSWTVSSENP